MLDIFKHVLNCVTTVLLTELPLLCRFLILFLICRNRYLEEILAESQDRISTILPGKRKE